MKKIVVTLLLLSINAIGFAQPSPDGMYGGSTGTDSTRFGALIGAGTSYRPNFAAPSAVSSAWGGAPAQSCAGVDFQTFLNTVNPAEMLNNLQGTYQSGKPAPVANYLLTLNTTNPTLAATLDMVDRQYTSRYQAFAQLCQAQETSRLSSDPNTRRMAEASDQCFSERVGRAISPTDALRECKTAAAVNSENIPGKKELKSFLEDHTNVTVTGEVEKLLPLLSDERITASGVEVRAPAMSLTQVKGNIEDRTRNAMSLILNGKNPDEIDRCAGVDYEKEPANAQEGCIPDAAGSLVRGKAFLAARQLNASEQELYLSAISEQIAAVTMQSTIIALRQSLINVAPKSGTSISAGELATRRARIQSEIQRLENDAAQLSLIADQRAQIARTQLLAVQRSKEQMDARRQNTKDTLPKRQESPVSGLASVFGL